MDASKGVVEYWTVYAPALAISVIALGILWNFLKQTLREHKADRDQWLMALTALTTTFTASQEQTRAYQAEMQQKIGHALGVAGKVLEEVCAHREATETAAKAIMEERAEQAALEKAARKQHRP